MGCGLEPPSPPSTAPRDGATPCEIFLSLSATTLAVKTNSAKRITAIHASGDSDVPGTWSPGSKRPILRAHPPRSFGQRRPLGEERSGAGRQPNHLT